MSVDGSVKLVPQQRMPLFDMIAQLSVVAKEMI
jgi:hypothetical protein